MPPVAWWILTRVVVPSAAKLLPRMIRTLSVFDRRVSGYDSRCRGGNVPPVTTWSRLQAGTATNCSATSRTTTTGYCATTCTARCTTSTAHLATVMTCGHAGSSNVAANLYGRANESSRTQRSGFRDGGHLTGGLKADDAQTWPGTKCFQQDAGLMGSSRLLRENGEERGVRINHGSACTCRRPTRKGRLQRQGARRSRRAGSRANCYRLTDAGIGAPDPVGCAVPELPTPVRRSMVIGIRSSGGGPLGSQPHDSRIRNTGGMLSTR